MCWLPLVPATIENGCPQIVPGLHGHGTLRHFFGDPLGWECFSEPPQTSVPGDVLVFSSLTPHLTGPNLTGEVRKAYILQTPRSAPWCWKGTRVRDRPVARSPATHPNCTCQLRGMASGVGRCLSKVSAID
jgi:ectoine hydroxylase-related dioxygenase (phytanoyl-CoA dioxygenase family)